ncbi:MAG: type 2 isopentenyl-diphosphate Delta-isomerase, partial [Bifidobacteriaceae bacterium]|nr:type 2 isopentenyl-diphosphate Delta-isomerase [Bifidobacteriaceae bacterium]
GEQSNDFDHVHLIRRTLPGTVVSVDSVKTEFFGKPVAAPFFINAMTGGSDKAMEINAALARVAAHRHIAMALGSANIVGLQPQTLESFVVAREQNPDGALLANVNPTTALDTVRLLVRELRPTALQIHVNAVQELVMPEGDRDFRWLHHLSEVAASVDIPVIVKEVGFGFDEHSLELLAASGIRSVDVAGSGGTNFSKIENSRRPHRDFDYLDGIGLSTVKSLFNAARVNRRHRSEVNSEKSSSAPALNVIASGGVRNPLDVLKSLVLGARFVGVSNGFLQVLRTQGEDVLDDTVGRWTSQLAGLLALYGKSALREVHDIGYYLDADLVSYLEQTAQ